MHLANHNADTWLSLRNTELTLILMNANMGYPMARITGIIEVNLRVPDPRVGPPLAEFDLPSQRYLAKGSTQARRSV
jgi:hypothetical protein